MKHPEVVFTGTALRISGYPFEPSLAYPSRDIVPDEVREIVLGYPSELRLKQGDIVFVKAAGKEALPDFANRYGIPIVKRWATWEELLDPFRDTWEEQAVIDRQFERLAARGLDPEQVNRIRREVGPAMVAYNFGSGLWEWVSLGLYDVLTAQKASLSRKDFRDFYERAMRIAQLDPERQWMSNSR